MLVCMDNDNAYSVLMSESRHPMERKVRELLDTSHDEYDISVGPYDAIQFHHHYDGGTRASKYDRDARVLYEDLRVDPDNPRTWFYYAQSLEHLGHDYHSAYAAYAFRAEMIASSREERWYSLYRMGYCMMLNNSAAIDSAAKHFLDAYDMNPARREPLYALAGFYRLARKWSLCVMYAMQALHIPFPGAEYAVYEAFAVEVSVYEWKVADEAATCLGELGRFQDAVRILDGALKSSEARAAQTTLSTEQRARLRGNLARMREKIAPPPVQKVPASSAPPHAPPSPPPPPPPPSTPKKAAAPPSGPKNEL